MTFAWLRGLLADRTSRVLATTVGVALAVSLIASIGAFLSATTSRMTQLAVGRVTVDWQVQTQAGAIPARVLSQVAAFPGVRTALPVQFATTTGFTAATGGSVQSTGPGRVLGIPSGYQAAFPGQIRPLIGSTSGVLLAQQTAANLHAAPGTILTIGRSGMRPVRTRVAGIVDLPAADALFQRVGAPAGAQPQAPPDNVILLPSAVFNRLMGPLTARRPDLGATQVHVALNHSLPNSPDAAFTRISGLARNLETRLAGSGLVGDNLGAALDHARADALYAQLLFLFLGLPGAVLAGLLTWEIAGTAAERRRRDQALLRTRGASTRKLMQLALAETGAAGVVGAAAGLGIALLIGRSTFGTASFGAGTLAAALWAIGATVAGLVVAATAIALPALRDARAATIITQRRSVDRDQRPPLWARLYLDLVALAVAAVIYWQASQTGYTLVLAPEGLPQVSVNWYALLAPVLGWIGAGLFTYRIADFALGHSRRWLGTVLRPLTGALSPTVAAAITRQRRPIARVIALVALTGAFAASTAVFNATYRQQAEVDARLTNGADVTVTEPPGTRVGPVQARSLAATPGVASVEPLQHRFAYVGADLQDLFGVRPTTIGSAGRLQNAWFQGGSAAGLMRTLSQHPDSVLVSAETVRDFQLRPGDLVRLRLQDRATGRLTIVPFHYAGIAKEFPTAPTDSFLVANGDYVARMTGTDAVATFLIQTDGTSPTTVASRLRRDLGVTAKVTDITGSRRLVGSSLTAVELSGLTRIELGFAAILAVASTGLVLILGFQERRRTFAITRALGAGPRQLGGFIWSEALVTTGAGLIFGIITAGGLTFMLVKILTGVFDPPPDHLAVPWDYLAGVTAAVVTGVIAAGMITLIRLREPSVRDIRDV